MTDFDDDSQPATPALQRIGTRLALAGYIPFLVLALWLYAIAVDHPWRADTIMLLKTYGAVILSFLGGIRFGLAVASGEGSDRRALILSMVPALTAWAALWIAEPFAFALLAAAFAAHGAWDNLAAYAGAAPAWFGRMRVWLTMLVVGAMVLAFLATA